MSQLSFCQNALIRACRRGHKPVAALALAALLAACGGKPPEHLGVQDGRLAPCPTSPNCVSSQAADAARRVAPLPLYDTPQRNLARLGAILAREPRVRLVEQQPGYLRAEFSSPLLRFVDDVEFLVDGQTLQVRSASRLGYWDFGANRRRIEALRRRLEQRP